MVVFVVVGMPASGKNIARTYAEKEGVPYFVTGDIVRAEAARRNLPADASNSARVSDELRDIDEYILNTGGLKEAEAAPTSIFLTYRKQDG